MHLVRVGDRVINLAPTEVITYVENVSGRGSIHLTFSNDPEDFEAFYGDDAEALWAYIKTQAIDVHRVQQVVDSARPKTRAAIERDHITWGRARHTTNTQSEPVTAAEFGEFLTTHVADAYEGDE